MSSAATGLRSAGGVVREWSEMIKLGHSLFALPHAVLAAFLAARPGLPAVGQFGLILVCMVGARSAAMTFNRIVDARFDAENPRTAGRHIPAGRISPRAAWAFFAAACTLFLGGCAGFLIYGNAWPIVLGVPTHILLGAAIAFSPVAAWIAIEPATLGATAALMMLAAMFWIAGFDLIYACQDAEFDRARGLHSVPARYGVAAALWMARGFHVVTVSALVGVGFSAGLGSVYFVGVALVAALLAVENAIVSPRDLSRVNLAFFTVNGVVGVVLGACGVIDVLLR